MSRRQSVPGVDRRARYEAVFREVYEPLQRYVRRRAAAGDADDVVAEALTVLWRRLDDVPADAVLAWTYGVARRCLANQRRGEGRRAQLVERVTADVAVPVGAPADDPALDAALSALSDDDRELLRLWAWEELAPREIAVVLGMIGSVVSEFVASTHGLGFIIRARSQDLDVSMMFAAILTLSVIGVLMGAVVRAVQRRVVFWTGV